jgi:hypothetical protein
MSYLLHLFDVYVWHYGVLGTCTVLLSGCIDNKVRGCERGYISRAYPVIPE